MIGKLQRVALREVWAHEALNFTTWLRDNIDILNDVLGFELSGAENEQNAGSFNVDIVAEDGNGNPVIVENQYGKTDHDHLGKILTYMTMLEAKAAIWIVEDPRPEHIRAMSWLNESASSSFYLIKIEAFKIGDSPPAPKFTVIVEPSDETRVVGIIKKDFADVSYIREDFWKGLIEKMNMNAKTILFSNISPSQRNWIGAGSGVRGLGFNFSVRQHDGKVELYIDRGKEGKEENEEIFDFLFSHKEEIEEKFGGELNWERLNSKRACRISKEVSIGGYRDEDKWDEQQFAMAEAMMCFEKAIKPFIRKLNI